MTKEIVHGRNGSVRKCIYRLVRNEMNEIKYHLFFSLVLIDLNSVSVSRSVVSDSAAPWTVARQGTKGSSVHGILQARILEWVAVPFSRGSSQPRD